MPKPLPLLAAVQCTFRFRWLPLFLLLALLATSLPVFAQQALDAGARQYNAAVALHNSEAYDLAAKEWIKFLNDFPNDSRIDRAWHYLGICYLKQNKLEDAHKTFKTVVKSFPKCELLADTLLNLGLTQYNIAQGGKPAMFDTAVATFNTLATKYPDGKHVSDAIFFEGECLYNRNRQKEAAQKYAEVVTNHAKSAAMPRALFALAVTQTDLGENQKALANYDLFLHKFPESSLVAEAILWRGETHYAQKDYAKAAKSYSKAAATKGFSMADYATIRQADALSAMKRYAKAATMYATVPTTFPQSKYVSLANLEAGKKYYAAKDFTQAQQFLGKVVAGGGKSAPEAAHWIAQSLLKQNKPIEALAVIEKAIPESEASPYAVALLMDQADAIYSIPQRRAESIGRYVAIAEKHPNSPKAPEALYLAAYSAMTLGDYPQAVAHAKAFLANRGDHKLALGTTHVLAESSLLLNQYAEAEKLYDQLLAKAPNDPDARIWKVHRATAMYFQKKYQETIDALTPLIGKIKNPDLLAEAQYRIGRSHAALKQYPAVAKSLEASLAAAPKWKLADDAHLMLAYAYQQMGDFAKAKKNAKAVISGFPNSELLDMAHYRLGECFRLTNDLKTAVEYYRITLKSWPKSLLTKQSLYGLGWAQIGLEDYAGAETTFSTLIEGYPNDPLTIHALYGRGIARRQLKKYALAVADLEAMLPHAASPAEKSRALYVLGLAQKGLNKHADASKTFHSLLAENPEYDDADDVYFELGWSLKSMKKEDDAAGVFAELAEKFPDSPLVADAQCLVGERAYAKKDYQKAAAAYDATRHKAGKSKLGEEATYKLGLSYYLQNDLAKARQTFNHLRTTWPAGTLVADGVFMEAECLFKEEKYDEAMAAYLQVKNPTNKKINVLALLHASQAAAQLKQWEKSLELATKLTTELPDAPQVPQALYQQGWAQQNLGKRDMAMGLYQQVIAKTNLEPAAKAQLMIGEIQFEQKKYQEAIPSFFKVAYGYGYPKWQADATYEAGRCFEVLKKPSQAMKQYQKVIAKFPDSDKVPLAKERLQVLK